MPETWGFTKPTADKVVAFFREPPTISSARTQRNKTPWMIGGGSRLVKTPSGGIAARSSTAVASESCVVQRIVSGALVDESESIDVVNIWPIALPGNFYLLVMQEGANNEWIAVSPGVLDVRWADPKLEQSLDKTTYTTIDTAEDCS